MIAQEGGNSYLKNYVEGKIRSGMGMADATRFLVNTVNYPSPKGDWGNF